MNIIARNMKRPETGQVMANQRKESANRCHNAGCPDAATKVRTANRVPMGVYRANRHPHVIPAQRDCRLRLRRILPGKSNFLLLRSPGIRETFGKPGDRERRGRRAIGNGCNDAR